MLRKIFLYYSAGGIFEVLGYIITSIKKRMFYKSRTLYLYRTNACAPTAKQASIEFIVFKDARSFESLDFKRAKFVNFQSWFSKGSFVVVGFINKKPISFSWCHFKHHQVDRDTLVDLGNSSAWIGPTFVHKATRGKGANKSQIQFLISHLPKHISTCLTSANIRNNASIKAFEHFGFQPGAILTQHHGLFIKNRRTLSFCGDGELHIRFCDNEKSHINAGL